MIASLRRVAGLPVPRPKTILGRGNRMGTKYPETSHLTTQVVALDLVPLKTPANLARRHSLLIVSQRLIPTENLPSKGMTRLGTRRPQERTMDRQYNPQA